MQPVLQPLRSVFAPRILSRVPSKVDVYSLSRALSCGSALARPSPVRRGAQSSHLLQPVSSQSETRFKRQLCGAVNTSNNDESKLPAQPSAIEAKTGFDLVLSPPALVVTRDYEWANIIIGFEQANKYTLRSAPDGKVIGYLAEESSITGTVTRNLLRTRRPFKATIFDTDGNILFTLRRPLFLVSTSIFVESAEGETLGEVHMNWHMWRRRYDLYADKTQFASVDSGLLAVDFDMRDVDGKKIASVNKDFTGFAREIFTDARQYVIRMDPRFGLSSDGQLISDPQTVNAASEDDVGYSEYEMGTKEKAVVLATAVAIDFDYFSVHSRGHHMNPGMMMMPGGGVGGGGGGAGAAVGADVLSESMISEEELSEGEGAVPTPPASGFEADASPSSDPFNPQAASDDPYGTPMNQSDENINPDDWATFEEPDHGFAEEPEGEAEESGGMFSGLFGGDDDDDGDDGDEGGGGLFGVVTSIFTDNE